MNKKNACYFLGGVGLALFFCFWNFTPVFSVDGVGGNVEKVISLKKQITAKKQKIAQLEQSIADFKKKIQEKNLEAVSLKNQIGILDARVSEIATDIEATNEKLDVLHLQISETELTIAQKEQQIDRQKSIVGELIRSLHEQDGKNYIEIAASHESFSDFYNQIHSTKTIEQDLGRTMRGLRLAKEELETQKKDLEGQKKEYTLVAEDLQNKKQDLVEQTSGKQELLTEAQSSQFKYYTLLSNLKAQYHQVENEILGIERMVRKKLEKSKKVDENISSESGPLLWPTPSHYITATFHDPSYPFRHVFEHSGLDIRASQGTPLRASGSGYVARAKKCTLASCYSYILIVHDGGISTLYGHLSKIAVNEDQFVARGDVIGYSGGTPGTAGAGPFVTGAHLHFEVRKNGIPVNPMSYLE